MNQDLVMVKTSKIDIYGRYIGDIFFDETGQKSKDEIFVSGTHLNQEMVSLGLVEIY